MVAEFRGRRCNVCALLRAARRRETTLRRSFIALGHVIDYVREMQPGRVSHVSGDGAMCC
jgi:hypothetical protein